MIPPEARVVIFGPPGYALRWLRRLQVDEELEPGRPKHSKAGKLGTLVGRRPRQIIAAVRRGQQALDYSG